MDLNSSPLPFSSLDHHISDDHQYDHHHQNSCHIFFNSDHTGYNYDHHQFYQPQHQTVHENYGYDDGSTYEIKNKVDSGLKLTLWKKEEYDGDHESIQVQKSNPVKWMSSKMRLMQKMKISSKSEDQKLQTSSSLESTDLSSNSSSYNNNSPIRVCADCNTTKTPLWRSGPKGPKSLCNACGIRQRKARRAMAAANGTAYQPVAAMKIKLQHKEKSTVAARNGHKKRFKTTTNSATSCGDGRKNNGFEDFLINLSKNLSFHRVFPEDEKNAAILLMALSSGLVHG